MGKGSKAFFIRIHIQIVYIPISLRKETKDFFLRMHVLKKSFN